MSFFKFYATGKKRRQNRQYFKIIICVFFTLMFTLNFLNHYVYSDQTNDLDEVIDSKNENLFNYDQNNLDIATDISMLQNPFTWIVILILMFSTTGIMIVYFKKKKWL